MMEETKQKHMRALVWDGGGYPEGLKLADFPRPEARPGWAVIEVKRAGICGTDLHSLAGWWRDVTPEENLPAVMGHEVSGIVAELGEGVAGLQVGDRVAGEPIHGCETLGVDLCPMCRIGQYNLCVNQAFVGIADAARVIPGGFGRYSLFHHTRLYKLPDSVDFAEGATLEPLATAVRAVKVGKPSSGDVVAILGCGVVGLDLIQCVRLEGAADIIAVAKYDYQAKVAEALGAKEVVSLESGGDPLRDVMRMTAKWGVDQVYECVGGETDGVDTGIAMCRPGGKVIVLGIFPGRRPIDLLTMVSKEVDVLSSYCYAAVEGKTEYGIGLDMVRNGVVNQKALISHAFPIEDWRQAFDATMHKSQSHALKVQLIP